MTHEPFRSVTRVPIRTDHMDPEQIKQLTAETAREMREVTQKFADPDSIELLFRCSLHTYYAQRIGRIT